jgi:hypothetical protein
MSTPQLDRLREHCHQLSSLDLFRSWAEPSHSRREIKTPADCARRREDIAVDLGNQPLTIFCSATTVH